MSSSRCFLDTIYFLYVLGKFFGISCYTISKGQKKYKATFGLIGFLQLVATFAVFFTLIYCNLSFELKNKTGNTKLFNQMQQILIASSLMFLVVGDSQIVLLRRRYWKIANTLHEIDSQMLRMLKIGVDHNKIHRRTLIHVSIWFSGLAVVYSLFGYYSFVLNGDVGMISQCIAYVMINGGFTLITIQLQLFMYSIYLRFSELNEFFYFQILPSASTKLTYSTSVKLQANIIAIASIADELNSLVPLVTNFFASFIIPAFVGIFVLTIFNFHNHYRLIIGENTVDFFLLAFIYDLVGFMFNVLNFLSVLISSSTTNEAKRMGVIVHKTIACTRNQQFILKLKILSLQIMHRSPNFSFGVISMNWSFVFSYVTSIASYVVILIQFQMYIIENSASTSQPQQEL